MKRKLTALLMVLAMVLTFACGASGETAVDVEQAIQGTWEIAGVTGVEDVDEDTVASAMQMIKAMGGSITLTFENGTCTMEMSFMGQSESESFAYTINDGKLNMGDSDLDVTLDGDTLTLSGEGYGMILSRPGAAPAVKPEGLPGQWKVTGINIAEGSEDTLASRIKAYFDDGGVFTMTFTEEQVTIALDSGESETADYAADDESLLIGEIAATYAIDDAGILHIVEGQDEIVLEYAGEAPKAKVEVPEGGFTLDGTWNIVGVEGEGDSVEEFSQILEAGAVMQMIFNNGTASMHIELMGQTADQELGSYTDEGDKIIMNGVPSYYTIEGDTLTMNEDGLVMTLVRAE